MAMFRDVDTVSFEGDQHSFNNLPDSFPYEVPNAIPDATYFSTFQPIWDINRGGTEAFLSSSLNFDASLPMDTNWHETAVPSELGLDRVCSDCSPFIR
jgi:hypothetical protein